MRRRDFFLSLLSGALKTQASSASSTRRRTVRHAPVPPVPAQLGRVGVSTLSFRAYFEPARTESAPAGRLALLDFPAMVADRFKIRNLEFSTAHLPSREPVYLQELRSSIARARSKLVNILVDAKEIEQAGGLSDADPEVRATAVLAVKSWIDIAKQLGARSVRCDPGCTNAEDLASTVDSYQKLASYGRAKNVTVLMENRCDAGCGRPETLVKILRAVPSPFLGALPDFGEFPDEVTRLRGLPVLFPYAHTVCHVRDQQPDPVGSPTTFDLGRCIAISQQAGYKGIYSVEFDGRGDPYQGVQGLVNELLRRL